MTDEKPLSKKTDQMLQIPVCEMRVILALARRALSYDENRLRMRRMQTKTGESEMLGEFLRDVGRETKEQGEMINRLNQLCDAARENDERTTALSLFLLKRDVISDQEPNFDATHGFVIAAKHEWQARGFASSYRRDISDHRKRDELSEIWYSATTTCVYIGKATDHTTPGVVLEDHQWG